MFAPPSPFYNNGYCVRELKSLFAPKPPQGVLVRGHAGFVINKLSLLSTSVCPSAVKVIAKFVHVGPAASMAS